MLVIVVNVSFVVVVLSLCSTFLPLSFLLLLLSSQSLTVVLRVPKVVRGDMSRT